MPRGNQIARQWRILRMLEASKTGLRAREIHARLGGEISERTVFRDLEHLQDAGFPVYDDDGVWQVLTGGEGGYTVPVDTSELLALLLSEELLAPMRSAEVVGALASLREKVAAMLSDVGRAYAEEIKDHMVATFVGPGDYADGTVVRAVEDAISRSQQVAISYWSPRGQLTERTVDPYLLWYADARLYLVGHCHLRGAVRTFLVDRIRHIEMLDQDFDVAADFDARAFTGSGLGAWSGECRRVELEFTPPVAHLAGERRFHPSQTVTTLADGGARVTMHVAGLPHVAAWVASFGGQVVARAPDDLVEMVRAVLRRGLAAHGAT
ncbi:helix-turn-helix transcriptional regulator [Haliangium sp.]|uniref:helix-turn-helix transcriptional regulator n=1 Tax=Haliangium sp. TaxID=2663208 RepID=UPI003D0D2473